MGFGQVVDVQAGGGKFGLYATDESFDELDVAQVINVAQLVGVFYSDQMAEGMQGRAFEGQFFGRPAEGFALGLQGKVVGSHAGGAAGVQIHQHPEGGAGSQGQALLVEQSIIATGERTAHILHPGFQSAGLLLEGARLPLHPEPVQHPGFSQREHVFRSHAVQVSMPAGYLLESFHQLS